ncbi:hypothetical protein ACFVIY_37940 [Streptomyces sp. NPDC127166]|uniref:hypothetical protein n=1 Tax=Streptomyces sp. NPDC127166 TaxID=3345380 RepID=UPI00364185D1
MTHPNTPQPGPYGPPPPKKKMGAGKIVAIVLGSIFGVLVLLGVLGAIVGDPDTTANDKPTSSPSTASATSSTPPPAPTTAAPRPTTAAPAPTTAAPTPAPTTSAPAATLPPKPDAKDERAFLDALNAIDPRIIKPGKEDQAVSRGINQCSSITAGTADEAKLAQLALQRFTVDTRLPEIATPETGRRINAAAHRHLCPGS